MALRLSDVFVSSDNFIKYALRLFELLYAILPTFKLCTFVLELFKRELLLRNLCFLPAYPG